MIKIAEYRVEEFLKKIATFNRKAVKLALPEVKVVKIGSELKEMKFKPVEGPEETYYIEISEYDLQGDIPRVGGWGIHSKVEPASDADGNFVYTNRGFEKVESLRTTKLVCEHCNKARARSCVYLLQNKDTGEQKLVGKSCLKDFLPELNIVEVLGYLESLEKLAAPYNHYDEEGEYVEGSNLPRAAWLYPVDMLVAESLVLIRRDGYVSKKAAYESGDTLVQTASLLANTGRNRHKLYSEEEIAAVFKNEDVKNCIDWIKNQSESSDFFYNLQLAISQRGAPWKMFGFVAAGVQMYLKSLEKAAEAAVKTNEWVGTVGKREVFHGLKIVRCTATEGHYGTTYVTGLEDEAGRTFIWFASNKVGEVGEVLDLKATVKDHGEYKGTKQTVITRATKV
jgi:hypothetical protein